ncbi:MAG: hypothetical protein ACD_3C00060G0006 [uncultured bacterium (gcode 4)]|uniref:Uncharacterized protein n=1 Tax=uncultured bacterium (gcode 4) TaxID=1234023 RepID=K2FBC2_9BACT|nr:MAG: hypothetical protein ACD_3C00060G0006 [uncultured bacterium (gcode 4)]
MKKAVTEDVKKMNKQEIIYSAVVEKELLHNWLVQREQLRTLKELNDTMKEMTLVLKQFENHQFLEIHRSKWKIMLYNLSLWMLFAIWTVLWLMLLSWSTYHFFKDSPAIKSAIENQLKMRQFDIQNIKDKVKTEISKENPVNIQEIKDKVKKEVKTELSTEASNIETGNTNTWISIWK